jgi:hypothetical protein
MAAFLLYITQYWYWVVVIIVLLTILIILLWRNFDIDEITPTPPFVKFKRKSKEATRQSPTSINVSGNKMWNKSKISVRRESSNVSDNTMVDSEIDIGAKPGPKTRMRKNR